MDEGMEGWKVVSSDRASSEWSRLVQARVKAVWRSTITVRLSVYGGTVYTVHTVYTVARRTRST